MLTVIKTTKKTHYRQADISPHAAFYAYDGEDLVIALKRYDEHEQQAYDRLEAARVPKADIQKVERTCYRAKRWGAPDTTAPKNLVIRYKLVDEAALDPTQRSLLRVSEATGGAIILDEHADAHQSAMYQVDGSDDEPIVIAGE
jgi:hypothetical protein